MDNKSRLESLRKTLPPFIARKKIHEFLGGLISPGYMANLDCKGLGPPRVQIGRQIGYLRSDLINWLSARASKGGDEQ